MVYSKVESFFETVFGLTGCCNHPAFFRGTGLTLPAENNRVWHCPGPAERMELFILFRKRKMNRKQNAVFFIGQLVRERMDIQNLFHDIKPQTASPVFRFRDFSKR